MPFDIATGTYTDAEALLPLDASGLPAVAGVTPRTPVASGPTDAGPLVGGVMPTTAMFGEQAAAGTADCAAAQAAGMSAENDRRAHYGSDILPVGAAYGDTVDLPPVPTSAVPPSSSSLYPEQGDEPTIAGGPFGGDEPL